MDCCLFRLINIDYYMLRAWYRFYAQVFNTIWASERYGIKSEWIKNDIRLLTCNNLFITYYTLKKIKLPSWSTRKHWQNCKATLPAKFDARRQPKSKIKRATQLVQPNYYNLFHWTIQTREVIWYHFTSELISYHFTGIIFIHGFITLISTHNM